MKTQRTEKVIFIANSGVKLFERRIAKNKITDHLFIEHFVSKTPAHLEQFKKIGSTDKGDFVYMRVNV